MSTVNLVIMIVYHIISAFIAFVLIFSIIKTKNIQEAILYCLILIPFILRVLHIK
ncbi:MAG: hypothetical protein Kow00103_10440 [Candidatus Caldatribacteriota bacterium]